MIRRVTQSTERGLVGGDADRRQPVVDGTGGSSADGRDESQESRTKPDETRIETVGEQEQNGTAVRPRNGRDTPASGGDV
ncbi:hypothetical protein C471_00080 [Halorubrum saccharovorum DSM 1137]|uniref:Uncharacterized protein n=1 Tax=Halorubrum saccharovorum DSM 1137 TaxID=1227484 RepID=M0E8X1_9EURY|nr:hypothetical protein [Halorubrum saccharovorum]ELZ43468.1 hypothetical protein C471_00080 [Halorubrum saccharovorum DSM 1137]